MKHVIFIIFALGTIGLTSCSDDNELIVESRSAMDFIGEYTSMLDCTGLLSEENDLLFDVIVSTEDESSFTVLVDDGDEAIRLNAVALDGNIEIPLQLINENAEQDIIQMSGFIYTSDEGEPIFSFRHNVDNTGWSTCSNVLIKQ